MLFRFSLYGFLKNQRYFEPFLILAFQEKGLTFLEIGLLFAIREITVITLEVPSGVIADVYGRRRAMILSFVAYIGCFLTFAVADDVLLLVIAMLLFGVGEAFRTGTHKAMIFTWLRLHGRAHERTRYYGFTRSWSKFGSAASVILAGIFVFSSGSYVTIFYFATIPYLLNIVNFLGYPDELDGPGTGIPPSGLGAHLASTVGSTLRKTELRGLMAETMGFEGVFHAVKDYIQPALLVTAVAMASGFVATSGLNEVQQSTLLVSPVYLVLYVLSGVASRQAHNLVNRFGSESRAASLMWGMAVVIFGTMTVSAYYDRRVWLIVAFVLLHVLQNLWRPILISRFDAHTDEAQGATVLSIESQARRVATMVLAPVVGFTVDVAHASGGNGLWPVGLLGGCISLAFLLSGVRHRRWGTGPGVR
jgi:MFS family permease